MRLTLRRAKEAFANRASSDLLDYRLNRVCERYLLNGKFMGSMARIKLAAPFGQATLPRQFRTLEGVKVNGSVYEIGNRWWDFLPGKRAGMGAVLDEVLDYGDGHAILHTPSRLPSAPPQDVTLPDFDFPQGQGTIAVAYTGTDLDNAKVHVEGRDNNELAVSITINANASTTNPFARISKISKQFSTLGVNITYTPPNDAIYGGVAVALARMEPDEEETFYRRYFIPTLAGQAQVAIEGFCKRRHIEFTRDTDILPFTNISALELGLDALQAEGENDQTLADQIWARGVGILNSELNDANAQDQVPTIRFHYPGRTEPRLTSHY